MKWNQLFLVFPLCLSLLIAPKSHAADDGAGTVVIIGSTVVGVGIGWWIMHSIREGAEAPDEMIKEFSALRKGLLAGSQFRPDLETYIVKMEKDSAQYFEIPRLKNDYQAALRMRLMFNRDSLAFKNKALPPDTLASSSLALAEVNGATQAAVVVNKKALDSLLKTGLGGEVFPAVGGNFLFADSSDFQIAHADSLKTFPRLLATGMKKAMRDRIAIPRWNLRYRVLESKLDSTKNSWRTSIGFAVVVQVLPEMLPDLKDTIYVAMSKVLFLTLETDKPLPEIRSEKGAFAGILMNGTAEAEETPKNVAEKLQMIFQQNDKLFQLR